LDSSAVDIQAKIHEQQIKSVSKAPCLLGQQWKSFDSDALGDLSNDVKAIILAACKVSSTAMPICMKSVPLIYLTSQPT